MNQSKPKNARLRILHLTFNMNFGGTEQVIRQLVTRLQEGSFEHRILCIDGMVGAVGLALQDEGIDVQSLPRKAGLDWSLVRAVRAYLIREQIDLVHCHQYSPWCYGWLAHWGSGAKVVFTEHGRFHPDRYRFKAWGLNWLMALTTGAMVAISQATRQALGRYEGLPQQGIQVVYNGIEAVHCTPEDRLRALQSLGLSEGDRVIGTVARLDSVKNQALMIQATAELLPRYPDLYLVLVGDGPARDQLEAQALALGIADRVRFAGFQTVPSHFLAAMQVFLLTSHTEGTSMTLLEAMSLGIPPVVTAVGGNPEIVSSREVGRLIPDNDGAALVRTLDQLLANPEQARRLGQAAQAHFNAHFQVNHMALAYARVYERLCRRRGISALGEAEHGHRS